METEPVIILTDSEWLRACTDPACELQVERFGRSRVAQAWQLNSRRVPEHYLFMLLDRGGSAQAGGTSVSLRPDSCVWIAPDSAHSVRCDDPLHPFRFFHWRFRLLRRGRDLRMRPDAILRADASNLRPLMESAWAEWMSDLPLRQGRLRVLLAAITSELLRQPASDHRLLNEAQRRGILEYIHGRLPAPIHPAELARCLGRSHDYATRLIRASFGLPPRQLILRERLRAAAEDLSAMDAPIARIAKRWGFQDQRYFARQFRRLYGCAPGIFQSRALGRTCDIAGSRYRGP